MDNALARVLTADGPDPEHREELMLFGQFVGSWDLVVTDFDDAGEPRRSPGEWHFGWVLEGRAIQDVWIVPSGGRGDPTDPASEYGTAIRVYDAGTGTWQVSWSGPVKRRFLRLNARALGDEIVLSGSHDGADVRWVFFGIEPDRFRWRNERSVDGGKTWTLTQRMVVTRRPG